ncbi:armadillo-type protein [Halteromyces radiatus]|uniref:armadillo-type protein n=1 Tax=Halteromyces radiatus TaxID=101107 RepID=UPI00221F8822|nr:armadillo-type protein [Halteromyces radiatus]KAI8085181.1 armadillo-type protein [Halteromyces radiatus]
MNEGYLAQQMLSSRPLSAIRRTRAGTMPSFVNMSQQSSLSPFRRSVAPEHISDHDIPTSTAVNRHRSGSLNLSTPSLHANHYINGSVFNSQWSNHNSLNQSQQTTQPSSPSTEQLLQEDSDFSIARTLRSIGLEESHSASDDDLLIQQQQQLRSLLSSASSTTNRSRSFSVNATAMYQDSSPALPPVNDMCLDHSTILSSTYAGPLEEFTREQNRPRSSSMGLMEQSSQTNGKLSWNLRRSPLYNMVDTNQDQELGEIELQHQSQQQNGHFLDHHLRQQQLQHDILPRNNGTIMDDNAYSLGDTELISNMLHHQPSYNNIEYTHDGYNGAQWNSEYSHMKLSHSSPTYLEQHSQQPMSSIVLQTATRSLWVGNIDGSVTIDILTSLFSGFGPIESVRLLLEKECAFVNFFYVEDAVHAKDDILGRLGGRIGNCTVRIGFGKADMAMAPEPIVLQPTRALWLGNIPANVTPSNLHQLFSPYGSIESVRVLTQKKCGFINFETVESATAAKEALTNDEIGGSVFTNAGTKAGFAKVLPMKTTSTELTGTTSNLSINDPFLSKRNTTNRTTAPSITAIPKISSSATATSLTISSSSSSSSIDNGQRSEDLWSIMKIYGADDSAYTMVTDLGSSNYFESIPPVPELGADRKFDAGRLREIRKRLDGLTCGDQEIDNIAMDCMDEMAGLCSDYIGNTVVQRFFEKCSEDTKTMILKQIGPHLAAGGIHKNGTWAVQKIIDNVKTSEQIEIVVKNMRPYVPSLLLDQFGNYAVQCCLRMGSSNNQFIFDAIVEKQHYIAQGRFGVRAIRGILSNELVTDNQRIFVAAALTLNASSLATNANGTLILSWLMDSTKLNIPLQPMATRLTVHLARLCTHKIGSQTIMKLVNHDRSTDAQEVVVNRLLQDDIILMDIMMDQARGLGVVHKLLISTRDDELASKIYDLLIGIEEKNGTAAATCYKKLLDDSFSILNSKQQ